MTLRMTLPFGKEDSVKNLAFSILSKEYPLRIIELANLIRRRYGKSVTFQAVRKALLELVEEGVLESKEGRFCIDRGWVLESKEMLESLYEDLAREKIVPRGVDSIGGEVSVFTFDSVNKMMKFWQDIIDHWYENFKNGDPNVNCYQAAHGWEGLLHPDREGSSMDRLKRKGIVSYALGTGNTPLDRHIWRFYRGLGVRAGISHSSSSFDKNYYVGTYGETIVQAHYPKEVVEGLEGFFRKNRSVETANLKELSDIVNAKASIKLTVIRNLAMARQINKSVITALKEAR